MVAKPFLAPKCSKLAVQLLLSLNYQGNILLSTKGRSQVYTLHTCCWNKMVKQVLSHRQDPLEQFTNWQKYSCACTRWMQEECDTQQFHSHLWSSHSFKCDPGEGEMMKKIKHLFNSSKPFMVNPRKVEAGLLNNNNVDKCCFCWSCSAATLEEHSLGIQSYFYG